MKTYPTQVLPIDKHGNVYHGPRTLREAEEQINAGRPVEEMAKMMEDAGFVGIATRLRKHHEITG